MDQALHHIRFATERLGAMLPPGARILDFGCGQGRSVYALTKLGYDARGVDVADHWNTFDSVPSDIKERLFLIPHNPCRLPFPDHHFDFCFSDQVFEHVFDYVDTFRELGRIVKPGAISCHRFPGPNRVMESHVGLPFPLLCYSRTYLAMWALCGWRGRDQDGLPWRETVAHNAALMRLNSYPTKRRLRTHAETAGVQIEFLEREEFTFRNPSRFARTLSLHLGLGSFALAAAAPFMSRYMVARSGPSHLRINDRLKPRVKDAVGQ